MSNTLKIALLSTDIACGDKIGNLTRLEAAISTMDRDVDLVIVPELFSTGFVSNKELLNEWAETNGGDTVAALHRLASQHKTAIAGSFLAKTFSDVYNRAFFIEPSGDEAFYDKRHLFSMSSESSLLTYGRKELPVVRYRGWNIAVAVCYDLRFPVWCRNKDLSYDILAVVANWPKSREYAWRHLLIARAIENQAYVIGVDRSGEDKFGDYNDMTMAFDYSGKELNAGSDSQCGLLKYVTLDHAMLLKWRDDFTPWKDADRFDINL